ncbi:unnamed protein product [Moneuplotes crassus]|uniref:Uncharacterized protein n=1 Tax=Euplotes crassus TaxID=5936 RepID=A0AAD1Y6A9_EUPCR|nr:unnamed protein product [Moneuplotes crassus]
MEDRTEDYYNIQNNSSYIATEKASYTPHIDTDSMENLSNHKSSSSLEVGNEADLTSIPMDNLHEEIKESISQIKMKYQKSKNYGDAKGSKRVKSHNFIPELGDEQAYNTNLLKDNPPIDAKLVKQYHSNHLGLVKSFKNECASPEVNIPPSSKNAHHRVNSRTRNFCVQNQSKTENELIKVENLQWVSDPKNNTNDFQNYLTEYKDAQTFSSGISSPHIRSPSLLETLDMAPGNHSRKDSKNINDSGLMNRILNNQENSHQIFKSWKQQNQSLGSKTNGDLTMSPADMNKLFNAMQLNSFDKKIVFQQESSNSNEPSSSEPPRVLLTSSKESSPRNMKMRILQNTEANLEKILHNLQSSLVKEQIVNMRKTLSSVHSTKLMSIKSEYEVLKLQLDNSLFNALRDLNSVAQTKDLKLHEILIDYNNMLHASESVIKGIQEANKKNEIDKKYDDIMKVAEKIILKHQLLLQNTDEALSNMKILELPDIKIGQRLTFVQKMDDSQSNIENDSSAEIKHEDAQDTTNEYNDSDDTIREQDYTNSNDDTMTLKAESSNRISGSFIIPELPKHKTGMSSDLRKSVPFSQNQTPNTMQNLKYRPLTSHNSKKNISVPRQLNEEVVENKDVFCSQDISQENYMYENLVHNLQNKFMVCKKQIEERCLPLLEGYKPPMQKSQSQYIRYDENQNPKQLRSYGQSYKTMLINNVSGMVQEGSAQHYQPQIDKRILTKAEKNFEKRSRSINKGNKARKKKYLR